MSRKKNCMYMISAVKTAFIIATGMKTKKMDAKTMTVQTMKNTRQAAGAATGGENGHEGKRHRS